MTVSTSEAPAVGNSFDHVLNSRVADFLYREAALLDDWRLDEWLELMDDSIKYRVPAWGYENGDPRSTLHVVNDDLQLIRGRVTRLKSKHAHAESPKSYTTRQVSNVHVVAQDGEIVAVRSTFTILRARLGEVDHFVGTYTHRLRSVEQSDGGLGFRIIERIARLGHPVIDAGGTVSIVL